MGLLADTRVYLAGPVEHDSKAAAWRDEITPDLEDLNITVWNPLQKPDWIMEEAKVDGPGQLKLKEELLHGYPGGAEIAARANHEIRKMGLRLAAASDFIICRLPKTFTAGTFEEIGNAAKEGKPVLFWVDEKYPSMWLYDQFAFGQSAANVFFTSREDLLRYLQRINNGKSSYDPFRWIFMSWRKECLT